jgi:hypothetical protein
MTKYTPGYRVGSLIIESRGHKTTTTYYEYFVSCLVCGEFRTISNIKLRHIEKSGEGDCGCTSISYIYFIHQPDGIKIGRTDREISSRFAVLQTHSPKRVKLIRILKGSRLLEHEAHEHFASYRIDPKKEWFAFTPSMLTWQPSLPFEEITIPSSFKED